MRLGGGGLRFAVRGLELFGLRFVVLWFAELVRGSSAFLDVCVSWLVDPMWIFLVFFF